MAALLAPACTAFALDWGADLIETYAQTRFDTTRSSTFDQQYRLHANGQLVPALDYFAGLNYRHLKSYAGDSASSWRTELLPSISAVWSAPFVKLRSDLTYRDNRDQNNVNRLTGHSLGLVAQSLWQSLPRLTGRYQMDQNVNDLDLLGINTQQRTISANADYSFKATSVRYEYSDSRTENRNTGLEQATRRHSGHIENYFAALDHLVTVQSTYEIAVKSDREAQGSGDGVLISLSPLLGLWGVNPTPELGSLASWSALIDGNSDSAASHQMDLSGTEVQNFGLDFGAPAPVDHIFVYADSLANPGLRWAVWQSSDNSVWTQVLGFRTYSFNPVFRRFEILFGQLTARYVKVVLEPQPLQAPVYVTEVRALLTRGADTGMKWTTDHEAAVHVGVQPAMWVSGAVEGTLIRRGGSPTSMARQQTGMMASLSLTPATYANLAGQYQLSRTEYPDASGQRTNTELFGVNLVSHWLPSLGTTVAVSRQRELTGKALSRRLDGGNVKLDLRLIPGLEGNTEAGITEDHRFLGGDLFKTRYIGQGVQAQPVDRITITANYRYYWLKSRLGWTPPFREDASLQWTYRMTGTVQVSGSANRFREPGKTYTTWDGILSWTPTPKLILSGGVNRTLPDQGGNTLLLTGQGIFRWSRRSDISVSYSRLEDDLAERENFNSLRLSFTYRI